MKVTRLKKGYRIRLTDREMDALNTMMTLGEAYMEGMDDIERDETEKDMGRAYKSISNPTYEDRR
jgi:hypothetical protein